MKYMAEDGKVFDTEEVCKNYEEEHLISYEIIDKAIELIAKEWGVYIPLRKKMELKTVMINVLCK